MRRVKRTILVVFSCAALLVQPVIGQEEEVRAAMERGLAAWRNGDFQVLDSYYASQTRGFMLDGGFLITGFSTEALEAAASAGVEFNVEPREIDILMVTNDVAVAVAILEGSVTMPGGEVQEGSWRYSETRVRESGIWKVIQYHFSRMTLDPFGETP